MLNYLKLVRLPNLLMVPLTMYLLRYGIVEPALQYGYSPVMGQVLELQMSNLWFLVLILINVLLGAAGYVINDYFDQKIDQINRPNTMLIGKAIHRRTAIIVHWTLNGLAVFLAAGLAYKMRNPYILVMYMLIAGVFWLYSSTYKKQFLLGNVIVALGTATIPLQVAYFEIITLNKAYGYDLLTQGLTFKPILFWLLAFAFFAFLTNFVREIVKDIEDFEGDSSYGCSSVPVVLGIYWAKVISIGLCLLIVGLLGWFYAVFLGDMITLIYFLVLIALPLLVVAFLLFKAKTVKHYRQISIVIKIIMLTGICYALVARYLMVFNFSL